MSRLHNGLQLMDGLSVVHPKGKGKKVGGTCL